MRRSLPCLHNHLESGKRPCSLSLPPPLPLSFSCRGFYCVIGVTFVRAVVLRLDGIWVRLLPAKLKRLHLDVCAKTQRAEMLGKNPFYWRLPRQCDMFGLTEFVLEVNMLQAISTHRDTIFCSKINAALVLL